MIPMCDTPEQTTLSGVFVNIRPIRVEDLSVILVCLEVRIHRQDLIEQ